MRPAKRRWLLLVVVIQFICCSTCYTQSAKDSVETAYPPELNKKKLSAVITTETAFYLGGMSYLQFVWYSGQDMVPFHFYNDAAGYLQVDKFGHAFGAYLESYLGYEWLRRSGVSRKKALIYGAPLGFFLQLPIEVFDGLYDGWGFSFSDVGANAAGSAIVVANELLFKQQLVKYKFSYHRSIYAEISRGYLGDNWLESLFYDYNGHTYWLSVPVSLSFRGRNTKMFCLSLGYSANGMFGEFENRTTYQGLPLPDIERHRQLLFSIDIDPTAIETRWKWMNTVLDQFFWIKIPAPALEWNTRDGFLGHAIYW